MEAFRAVSLQTVEHPIALHRVVRTRRSPLIGGREKHVINLRIPKYVADADDPEHGISVEASIWTRHADWFDDIAEGDEFVVLGMWKAEVGQVQWPLLSDSV
ncbi:hypothetical protein NOV72_05754 [Caballeronia novacaledonica]|uniref:Uncharacterized protein n=1 Tax=Caballeronia novacaledonica TaxID=1544861 RepID=A0A2U3IEC3_9BURK|nr:hypothetical protein [Caballeronia novacaledonica]SPB18554.1 hypothetical protein NOV72_05754 [Caballeronia novacaledonica]